MAGLFVQRHIHGCIYLVELLIQDPETLAVHDQEIIYPLGLIVIELHDLAAAAFDPLVSAEGSMGLVAVAGGEISFFQEIGSVVIKS